MARRSRNTRNQNNLNNSRLERDLLKPVLIAKPIRLLPIAQSEKNLRVFEDRRTSWPTIVRPAFAEPRSAARLVARPSHVKLFANNNRDARSALSGKNTSSFTSRIAFAQPKHVVVCARRSIRSEVLHALGIAGRKGVGRGRARRRNEWSDIGC